MGMGEFLPSNWLMDFIAFWACGDGSLLEGVCENVVFLLCGYDQQQMNETMLETIASHIPAGTSTFTILQYAQEINSKDFGGMDWGEEKNMIHHNSAVPPSYDLHKVNTPVCWVSNNMREKFDNLSLFRLLFSGVTTIGWLRQKIFLKL